MNREKTNAHKDKSVITIKRYQNRKLYDTINSTYVTLEDIAQMIRQGDDVRVIDNRTRDDLTSVTLAQIIFEEEKKNPHILPLNFFKRIINDGQNTVKDFLMRTTDQVQNTIAQAREGAETFYDRLGHNAEDNLLKGVIHKTQHISKNIEDKIKATVENITHTNELNDEIQGLRQKVLYLEKKLKAYEK